MAAETAVFRCQLCCRSAFAGRRGHLYSAGHQRRLRAALARLGEKVAAARAAARRAVVLPFQAGEHERRVWCLCCAREVRRHLSRGARTVLHGGLLQHLASPEHRRAVAAFWWKNRADPKLKPDFLLSSAEYQRFQESLSKALDAYEAKEDAAIQKAAAHIREVEQKRQEMVRAILEETGGEGNIHTGAKPPWLMSEEEEGERQIGPSYEEFLKEKQKQKLKKLPPNRVGANFDHSSQTGDSWLPSFGRVWNHGRRWQSRHQFKAESGNKQPGPKRKRPRTN